MFSKLRKWKGVLTMISLTQTEIQRTWNDELIFIDWQRTCCPRRYKLSKKKLLKSLSEIKQFTELNMLILDNLSSLYGIYYYNECQELILSLSGNVTISINARYTAFHNLLMSALIEKIV